MLGLLCRHCGTIETTHDPDVIGNCLRDGGFLEYLYCELVDPEDRELGRDATPEEYSNVQVQGYRYCLTDCPGFEYSKSDRAYLVSKLVGATSVRLDEVEHLPEAWATAIHRSRARAARAEEKRLKTASASCWGMQTSVLIIPGRRVIQLD